MPRAARRHAFAETWPRHRTQAHMFCAGRLQLRCCRCRSFAGISEHVDSYWIFAVLGHGSPLTSHTIRCDKQLLCVSWVIWQLRRVAKRWRTNASRLSVSVARMTPCDYRSRLVRRPRTAGGRPAPTSNRESSSLEARILDEDVDDPSADEGQRLAGSRVKELATKTRRSRSGGN